MPRIKVITVVGPTAAEKSDLAVEMARRLDGEVISADSMQLYRGMDIGTAKLTPAERRGVPHHLLDVWVDRGQADRAVMHARNGVALPEITDAQRSWLNVRLAQSLALVRGQEYAAHDALEQTQSYL